MSDAIANNVAGAVWRLACIWVTYEDALQLPEYHWTYNHHVISIFVARPEGLEPPAYWFEANRSIQLSYGRDDSVSMVPLEVAEKRLLTTP